ncbi:hypothetical protein WDU94_008234 [Cyamophila willieti]
MWFTTSLSDGSSLKSSLRTKIKRGKFALTRQNSSSSLFSSSEEKKKSQKVDKSSDVSGEWEFVNFNPISFNRRNSIAVCTHRSVSSSNLLGDTGGAPYNGTLVEEEVCDFPGPLPEPQQAPPVVIKRRCSTPNATPPNSRPPSWLSALPTHFFFEDEASRDLSKNVEP